jgi:selenocysteine lyase/cysteine desulfurase
MDALHSGKPYTFDYLRNELIGRDAVFETPFGSRHIFYADYTASGRGLRFIQEKLVNIQRSYANTHTEDDYSGRYLTNLLKQAEHRIKECVGAGPDGKVVAIGSGATGALKHLQEMIGVYIPPVTKDRIYGAIKKLNCDDCTILEKIRKKMPVVFIGPYEHHANELMWREAFAEVRVVPLNSTGTLDLEELERMVSEPALKERVKFGSFSAGSNITGIKTDVYEVARICHAHDTYIFFDFAAAAPYVEIDMNRDNESYFDALFFSPHKFIGGPGSAGILVFREEIYRNDLPPTTAGGGTVDFVGYKEHNFSRDIETREKAGTPPILQTIQAALVLDLKGHIGIEKIEEREIEYTRYFLKRIREIPGIELIGNIDAEDRIAIVSFNIRHEDRLLHPKFVTRLMNDLFGVQSRAGCSCAGPYGHALLHIDSELSEKHRALIQRGICGMKPGWVRINLHYLFSREDIQFLIDVIEFIAAKGKCFLPLYSFDITSGDWHYTGWRDPANSFSLEEDFSTAAVPVEDIPRLRDSYLRDARNYAEQLKKTPPTAYGKALPEIEGIQYFYYI